MHKYSTAKSYGSFHRAGAWKDPFPKDAGKRGPNSSPFSNLLSFGTTWRGMQWIRLFILFYLTFCLVAIGMAQICNSTDSQIYLAREGVLSAGYHGFVMRGSDGSFYVTGQTAQPDGVNAHLVPTKIDPSNGYSYVGNIMHAYAFGSTGYILHTDQKVYVWGNILINGVPGSKAFQSLNLPAEINPSDIKTISATSENNNSDNTVLGILMKDGSVYVYSDFFSNPDTGSDFLTGYKFYGNNSTSSNRSYNKVSIRSNHPISHLVMGSYGAFAYSENQNKFYTWGSMVHRGDGNNPSESLLPVEMTNPLPSNVSVVKIDLASRSTDGMTYYILGSDGKIYTMGIGKDGLLGQGNQDNSNSWITVKNPSGQADLIGVVYIDAQNSSRQYPTIGAILSNGTYYLWGSNNRGLVAAGGL
jgi:hypothetical protein